MNAIKMIEMLSNPLGATNIIDHKILLLYRQLHESPPRLQKINILHVLKASQPYTETFNNYEKSQLMCSSFGKMTTNNLTFTKNTCAGPTQYSAECKKFVCIKRKKALHLKSHYVKRLSAIYKTL